jgi:Bacterial SH3 domain
MYTQYPPQPDPMRIFFYGFSFGFVFAIILLIKFFDAPLFSARIKEDISANSVSPKPKEQEVVPLPKPAPTQPVKPQESTNQYRYGSQVPPINDDNRFNAVVIDALSLRDDHSLESNTIRRLQLNELVQVLEQTSELEIITPHNDNYPVQARWYRIVTAKDNKEGWVFGSALARRN